MLKQKEAENSIRNERFFSGALSLYRATHLVYGPVGHSLLTNSNAIRVYIPFVEYIVLYTYFNILIVNLSQ
jgi:hypothetical protein